MRTLAIVAVSVLGLTLAGPGSADTAVSRAFARSDPGSRITVDHAAWARVLSRRLQIGEDGINRFDYARTDSSDRATVAAYIDALEKVSPERLNGGEQHAYWINLYNAATVKVVLDHYPVSSIRDVTQGLFSFGPWEMQIVSVEGHRLSLNNIEHDILRRDWRDPRVHYALNCASLGCPNLQPVPYTGDRLDAELDSAARTFINHPRGVALRDGRLTLSRIYQWYARDFGGTDATIIAHLRRYAGPGLASRLANVAQIDSYQYDWQLNVPGSRLSAQ